MLTTAQATTLSAALRAETDPTVVAALAIRNDNGLTDWCNALTSYIVWRTSVPLEEIMRNGMDWTRVDNLSVGKARIWDWLSRLGTINPSQVNVRAGIDATWVGTAADLAVRAAVYTHCKRAATWAEKLFASGTGSDAVPGTLTFDGTLQQSDVSAALNENP